jgi:Flp pilus assembly protein TadD
MRLLQRGARSWWLRVRARWLEARAAREIREGHYERAEDLARAALKIVEEESGPHVILLIGLLNTLGMSCKYQRKFADGCRAYLRALALAGAGRESSVIASLYHNLGGLEHARGRYRRAEPLARRAVALRERALGTHHPDVARDVAALAAIVDGRGRHAEAETLHRRALAVFQTRLGARHRETAAALGNLAACLHAQGRAREAETVATQASAMSGRLLGVAHPDAQLAAANLAAIRRQMAGGLEGLERNP